MLGIFRAWKVPAIAAVHRERSSRKQRPELTVPLFRVAPAASAPVRVSIVDVCPMQRSVKRVICHVWKRPGSRVARKGAAHGPAIAEEQNVGGLKENGIHARCSSD